MDALVIAGSTHRPLAEAIARGLTAELAPTRLERFPDGELSVRLDAALTGRHAVIVQSLVPPTGEPLLELALLRDAAWRSGAARVSAVVPYLGYARQDRRMRAGEALGGPTVARLVSARLNALVTLDLHAEGAEGWFDCPVEQLSATPWLAEAARRWAGDKTTVVAPDLGGAKRAGKIASLLGLPLAVLHKTRSSAEQVTMHQVLGEVRGRSALIVDDMISTAGTIEAAVLALRSAGAERIAVAATHALLCGPAVERLEAARVDRLFTTDSIVPRALTLQCEVVPLAPRFVEVLRPLLGLSG